MQEADAVKLSARNPTVSASPAIDHPEFAVDGDLETGLPLSSKETVQLDIQVSEAFTARSATLFPGIGDFKTRIEIQAWEEGGYQTIREVKYDRRNGSPGVGPMPKGAVYVALPPTKTDRFRLIFSPRAEARGSAKVGTIAEVEILSAARVEYAVEKQLGKMFPKPLPLWGDYLWPDPPEPNGEAIDPRKVINLTGQDTVELPAGEWVIQRIGMLSTGVENGPAAPHATGLEVDKMNRAHLEPHFDAFVGELLRRLTPEERTTLKYVVGDSYEKGPQNWTDDLENIFQETYGYDPIPFLPVLSGRVVGNAETSDRFLWDLRRLVADRVADEYVGGLRDLCHEHNLKLWLENYGHWGFPGEFMRYGGECDLVAGEFWVTGTLGNIECRAAASTAHAYGKPMVYAEAFTSGVNWDYAPFDLKARGDWAFTEGINHFVLHLYIQQPDEVAPGMNAWFGTEFNRHNTWFYEGKEWFDYLRRCHVLLQQGLHVADFAYFIGEDAPIMTGTCQPALPKGYDFDYINAEVILERMSVKDGRWTLPDGKSYAVLVLPPLQTMRPAVLQKLSDLVKAGGVLYGDAPLRSPSLHDVENADRRIAQYSDELWEKGNVGKGHVFRGVELSQVLDELQLGPDVSCVDDSVLWIHRQTPEMDIYFLSNQQKETVQIEPVFRVAEARQPELWYADTGKMERVGEYTRNENGIRVPLTLDPAGSVFVVFRKPGASADLPVRKPLGDLESVIALDDQAWSLEFMPGRDVPEHIKLDRVGFWTELEDEAIVHYSGTATYRTSFKLSRDWKPEPGERVELDLGEVGEIARVHLNGTELGLLWKPPFRMEVSDALKAGTNELTIDVTNLWSNRMVGEQKYPDGFPGREGRKEFHPKSSIPGRGLEKRTIQPSGIAGPVRIERFKVRTPEE